MLFPTLKDRCILKTDPQLTENFLTLHPEAVIINESNISGLLNEATNFQDSVLKKRCEDFLCEHLDFNQVGSYLDLAIRHTLPRLKALAWEVKSKFTKIEPLLLNKLRTTQDVASMNAIGELGIANKEFITLLWEIYNLDSTSLEQKAFAYYNLTKLEQTCQGFKDIWEKAEYKSFQPLFCKALGSQGSSDGAQILHDLIEYINKENASEKGKIPSESLKAAEEALENWQPKKPPLNFFNIGAEFSQEEAQKNLIKILQNIQLLYVFRTNAADQLARMGSQKAFDAILKAYQNPSNTPVEKIKYLRALGNFQGPLKAKAVQYIVSEALLGTKHFENKTVKKQPLSDHDVCKEFLVKEYHSYLSDHSSDPDIRKGVLQALNIKDFIQFKEIFEYNSDNSFTALHQGKPTLPNETLVKILAPLLINYKPQENLDKIYYLLNTAFRFSKDIETQTVIIKTIAKLAESDIQAYRYLVSYFQKLPSKNKNKLLLLYIEKLSSFQWENNKKIYAIVSTNLESNAPNQGQLNCDSDKFIHDLEKIYESSPSNELNREVLLALARIDPAYTLSKINGKFNSNEDLVNLISVLKTISLTENEDLKNTAKVYILHLISSLKQLDYKTISAIFHEIAPLLAVNIIKEEEMDWSKVDIVG